MEKEWLEELKADLDRYVSAMKRTREEFENDYRAEYGSEFECDFYAYRCGQASAWFNLLKTKVDTHLDRIRKEVTE